MKHATDEAILIAGATPGVVLAESGGDNALVEQALHYHEFGQLQVIERGLMAAEAGSGRWIMPPGRLGWLPPRWPHAGRSYGSVRVLVLYLDARRAACLPSTPRVLALSPFVTALFERLRDLGTAAEERRNRMLDVLCDEFLATQEEPLHLPMPREPRLVRMCQALVENPADHRTLDHWARDVGMSRRSLTRSMLSQTGLSFGRWRTQARLMAAVRMLSERKPVIEVSLSSGFESVSSFIASFRKHFGSTPRRFLSIGPMYVRNERT